MLLRSTGTQLSQRPSRQLLLAYEQLTLPWLCPAVHGIRSNRRPSSTASNRLRKVPPLLAAPSMHGRIALATDRPGRGFASPAPTPQWEAREEHVPFDAPNISASWSPKDSWSELPPWDAAALVRSPSDAAVNPEAHRHHAGLRGEVEEIHGVLIAYLQVGQFEAAANTLRRIHSVQEPGSASIYKAYMAYIATLASHIIVNKDAALLNTLARWFNEEVRAKGIQPNGTMIMLLVQASLRAEKKQKGGRMIRHLLHLAQKDGVLDDALSEIEICFSDEEYRRVREVSSLYYI
jgi:DNA-directed RNA polymerase